MLSSDVRESDAPWAQWEDQDTAGLTAHIDYKLGSGNTLTYQSAVRHGDFSGRYSLVGTRSPPSLTDAAKGQREKYTGITQDPRLSSSTGSIGPLRWVAGLYFLREDTEVIDNSIATTFLSMLGPGSVGDILDGEFIYDQENITRSSAARNTNGPTIMIAECASSMLLDALAILDVQCHPRGSSVALLSSNDAKAWC